MLLSEEDLCVRAVKELQWRSLGAPRKDEKAQSKDDFNKLRVGLGTILTIQHVNLIVRSIYIASRFVPIFICAFNFGFDISHNFTKYTVLFGFAFGSNWWHTSLPACWNWIRPFEDINITMEGDRDWWRPNGISFIFLTGGSTLELEITYFQSSEEKKIFSVSAANG